MNKKLIPIAIIIAGILIGGSIIYINISKCQCQAELTEKGIEILSLQEASEKAINFINDNLLRGRATASLIESTEENGLYKIKFSLADQEIESYLTRDGEIFFPEAINLSEAKPVAVEKGITIGSFSVSDEAACKENGKPIVYFFGSEGCPHCSWEHPIIEKVAGEFKDLISFRNYMGDFEDDIAVFQKYSTGGVPTLVLGCKYYRVGSGEQLGEEEEEKILTALICKLTEGEPAGTCDKVEDLINQIHSVK